MAYSAKVILKTKPKQSNTVVTTLEVTLPRIVLAEFNTHRTFSRNSASSRAIPVEKQIAKVLEDPFIPEYWGKNQKGMQAEFEIDTNDQEKAKALWLNARDNAVKQAEALLGVGIHKQITNRLLEPFMWQTIIVTATDWDNFYALRRSKDAQPEIKKAADMMFDVDQNTKPDDNRIYHTPLVTGYDENEIAEAIASNKLSISSYGQSELMTQMMISSGRCARVSYLTHDGKRSPQADIDLAEKLLSAGHMSPFEHASFWSANPEFAIRELNPNATVTSNFSGGWIQFRKLLVNEHNYSLRNT